MTYWVVSKNKKNIFLHFKIKIESLYNPKTITTKAISNNQ